MQESATCVQAVCITDPVLATQVLQSKVVDKLRFPYSFLDPVSTLSQAGPALPSHAAHLFTPALPHRNLPPMAGWHGK